MFVIRQKRISVMNVRVQIVRKDIEKLQGKSMGRSVPLPSSLHPCLPSLRVFAATLFGIVRNQKPCKCP